MKYLRRFNESKDFSDEVNDILNIARDEYECVVKEYSDDQKFFKIYNDFENKDKFIRIVRDVLDRLYEIGVVDEDIDTTILQSDRYGKFKHGKARWNYVHVNKCRTWYEDDFVTSNDIRSVEMIINKDIK